MKPTVLFLTVLGCVTAIPGGYYHQEYNYKTSASSYKNNELQHQTDDQGYYKRDGDLEGKVRPRVDANSEHSEYVNPNSRNNEYNTGLVGGANGDLSSYGHMRANVGSYGSHGLSSDGVARADHLVGTKSGSAYSGYSGGSYATNSHGSQSYGMSSNLRSITSHLQEDLERELQDAIQEQRAYSQSRISVADLERELRQNLTNRLNSELASRYGQQSIQRGLSYTISGGRLQSTANYDNQELQDLKTQLEHNLLNRLRTQYSQNNYQSSQSHYDYSSTARPDYYYHQEPYRPATTIRPTYYIPTSQIRYTPVSNPESITSVASRVQNQLDTRLNQLLEEAQRRYFSSSSSYSLTNADVVLENLRNELRNNITYLLNEDIKSNYGNQIPRDGYMYSVGPSGQTSSQHNYAIRDLENLRAQVESNLIQKLNRDFETRRSRWQQQSSQHSSSNTQYGVYSTPRYDIYNTPRYDTYSTPQYNSYHSDVEHLSTTPSSSYIVPLIVKGGGGGGSSSSNRHYNILAGSRQSGYEISSGGGGSSISELQSRLQQDLSRQLQAAISRNQYGSYSSSGSYQAPTYQSSLQELSNELNRNLTRQLQEYSASGYYSSHGNYDQAQLDSLRNQLQSNLQRQLQQGLQQSFQSSSSYSSSSSSSSSSSGSGNENYRPVRGFDNYQSGQYRSGGNVLSMNGADCVNDDPNAYNSHRMKRSYPPYRSRPLGLSSSANVGYSGNYGFSGGYGRQSELGQQVDESDLTQQVEDVSLERLQDGSSTQQQVGLGQQVDDSDLTQQVEDSGIGSLHLGSHSQQQVSLGQQVDDSDLTQQVEDQHFGRFQVGGHNQQQVSLGQQVDDSDLTQQVEDQDFGRLQVGAQSQQQVSLGQQVDDSDLTQQVEDQHFGRLQIGGQNQQQVGYSHQVDDSELTQQVQNENFGQLQLGSQGQQVDDDVELTQQVQDSHPGKLQLGSQYQVGYGQQVDDSELTQQVQHENFGQLQLGSHGQQVDDDAELAQVQDSHPGKLQIGSQHQVGYGQQVDDSTQQVEDFGNVQLGSQTQQQDLTQQVQEIDFGLGSLNQIDQGHQTGDSDLTQQVEDSNFGKLQIGSQLQQQVDQSQDEPTPQVENVGLGNLHLGSQGSQQIQIGHVDNGDQQVQQREDIENSDLTQQVEEVNFGGQPGRVNNPDLTEQIGGTGLGKLQVNSQNQQRIQYGTQHFRGNANYPQRQQQTELGQEEDNSDLTQQVENQFTDTTYTGPLQNSQQREDSGSFTSQGQISLGNHQTSNNRLPSYDNNNQVQLNFNTNQREAANQLEEELSRQLQDAVKSYYTASYSRLSNYESTYQDLVRELERNLTQQLQSVRPTGSTRYTYSYVFSGPQKDLLKTQLENELKLKLEHELSTASGNRDLSQQQSNQEKSNIELNQNNDLQSQTQENINSDLTQQQQHGFQIGNIEVGGQEQTRGDQLGDLTQQEEYDQQQGEFGQGQLSSNALVDGNNRGRLELQTQQIEQESIGNSNDLTQHVDNSHGNVQLPGQQFTNQYPQRPNPLTQPQFGSGSSGRLQFGRRPVHQRPIDNTNFINTEITQQQQLYPNQNSVNQQYSNNYKPHDLPTLNQVIQQQQANEETSTDIIEALSPTDNLNQQEDIEYTDGQQQENADLSFQNQNSADQIQTGSQQNVVRPGFSINKPPSYSQVAQGNRGYTSSGSVTLQTNQQTSPSFEQHQDSLSTYLNNRQIQSVHQLENDLSRRLQYEISRSNNKISQSTPTDEIRQQQSQHLQIYLTQLLEKAFNEDGHSGYSRFNINSLSPEQKDKLQKKLLADLSTQLQQNIQVSYSQDGNGQSSFGYTTHYQSSATGQGSIPYPSLSSNHRGYTSHHLNYGQQEVIPDSDTVSEFNPSQPQRATVVQNVEPQGSNYNIGVKGSRRFRISNQNTLAATPVEDTEAVQPQSELVSPSSETPGSVPQEVADLNKTPPAELPWWKRVGNKISQGASNLKEKIIG